MLMNLAGLQTYSGYLPRAPPNDPERSGNIWQQHEQLQAQYQQLLDQNTQMASERTHYQNVCLCQPTHIILHVTHMPNSVDVLVAGQTSDR